MNTIIGLAFSLMATFNTGIFCSSSGLAEMSMDLPVQIDWNKR